ncbi:tRNA-specific adenosine deaminase TAD3 isoform X3 [Dendrobium catenatum]|uniref:tRNA-specific adenosine deaminase TAD3 isoform X3 n=1 Tax=Dendrobium catenatum TaxID=906689 RepID=UPI00109F7242|nr:tRNA-specific adenosine deaminase TAD3 isoform X3 [Dendrobium catenatum]
MPWQIVHVPDKPPSSPELSTVDVLASVIEPKLANTLVRQLNQICPLENLRHVKRVQKRSVEGKVELSVILCRQNEHESLCAGMPNDVLQLASTYQLSPYKTKVAKYAALSKEEWKEQCKLWSTSYHPSTIPYELTGFAEEESQLIFKYMKFAMRLMRTPNGKLSLLILWVGKLLQVHGGDSLENIPEDSKSKLLPCDSSRVSCMYPWRWTETRSDNGKEKCDGNFSWHPLRHATLVSIENAAARDRQLFPCLDYQNNLPLRNGGVCDCSENNPIKRQKIQLSENVGVIAEDVSPENLPSEVLRPYLCTGFDIYILWEPCVMCAMALVHQRIRRIFYAFPNPIAGALGSVYSLQGEKSLNHHYSVFRIQIPEEYY